MANRKSAAHLLLPLVLLVVLVISQSVNGDETDSVTKKVKKVIKRAPELPDSEALRAALAILDGKTALSFNEALAAIETVIGEMESAKQKHVGEFPVEHERLLKDCKDYLSLYERRDENMADFRRLFQRITWLKRENKHLAAYFDECTRVQMEHYGNVETGKVAQRKIELELKKQEKEEKIRKLRESTKPPELPESEELRSALTCLTGEDELGFDDTLAALKTVVVELMSAKQAQEGKLPIEHERLLNKYQDYLDLYQGRDHDLRSRKRIVQKIAWTKKEAEHLAAYFDECLRVQTQHYNNLN